MAAVIKRSSIIFYTRATIPTFISTTFIEIKFIEMAESRRKKRNKRILLNIDFIIRFISQIGRSVSTYPSWNSLRIIIILISIREPVILLVFEEQLREEITRERKEDSFERKMGSGASLGAFLLSLSLSLSVDKCNWNCSVRKITRSVGGRFCECNNATIPRFVDFLFYTSRRRYSVRYRWTCIVTKWCKCWNWILRTEADWEMERRVGLGGGGRNESKERDVGGMQF